MNRYKCVFMVNGTRTEQIVNANTAFEARKLVEAQYGGAKIVWVNVSQA